MDKAKAVKKRKRLSKAERMARKEERLRNASMDATVAEMDAVKQLVQSKDFDKLEPLGTLKPYLRSHVVFELLRQRENKRGRFRRLDHEFRFPLAALVERTLHQLNASVASKVVHDYPDYSYPCSLLVDMCIALLSQDKFEFAFATVKAHPKVCPMLCKRLLASEDVLEKVVRQRLAPKSLAVKQARFLRLVFRLHDGTILPTCPVANVLRHDLGGPCRVAQQIAQQVTAVVQDEAVIFGSRAIPGMFRSNSDVDMVLRTTSAEEISTVAELLRCAEEFTHVEGISSAAVPIVTFEHKSSSLRCDLSFSENMVSVKNSRAVEECCRQTWFAAIFLRGVRKWALEQKVVAGAGGATKMNRFAWDLLSLHFLQSQGYVGMVRVNKESITIEDPCKEKTDTINFSPILQQFWTDLLKPKDGEIIAIHEVDLSGVTGLKKPLMWALLDPGSNKNLALTLTRFEQEKIRVCALQTLTACDNPALYCDI